MGSAARRKSNEHILACLLARGHLLVEDLPGLGKTTLAKALARALAADLRMFSALPIYCRETSPGSGCLIRRRATLNSCRVPCSPMCC